MITQDQLTHAIAFIGENGTILERARLLKLLVDAPATPEVYDPLIKVQNEDGGFPSRPRPGSRSALDSSLTALWQFEEMDMLSSEPAQRTFDFLFKMQREDGGWDENPVLPGHDLPPWIVPSSPATRLYLSSYAAYWLGYSRRTQPPSFPRALTFLAAHQQPDGSFPGYRHTNWLAISALLFGADSRRLPLNSLAADASSPDASSPDASSPDGGQPNPTKLALDVEAQRIPEATSPKDYTQVIQQGIAYLAAIPFAEWEDSQVGWMLDCFSRAGLTVEHPYIAAALAELLRRQGADGSWAPDEGPVFAASATVTALKVIKRLTSLPPLA